MSSRTNNLTPVTAPGNWQRGQGYGAYGSNNNSDWNRLQARPPLGGPPQNASGRSPVEERTSGLVSFLIIDDKHNEQKKASKKLRKGIYNPAPKRRWKLSLYYRDDAKNNVNKNENMEDGDDNRCTICLDDFEPRQVVMLTPCSHIFHEGCILPWVRSSGRCPVCRFAISE